MIHLDNTFDIYCLTVILEQNLTFSKFFYNKFFERVFF